MKRRQLRRILGTKPRITTAPRSGGDSSEARRAIEELEKRLAQRPGIIDTSTLKEQIRRDSWLVKGRWVRAGLLVRSGELGHAWSVETRLLGKMCERGELYCLKFVHRRWYDAVFKSLTPDDVRAVCLVLRSLDPSSQFLFWHWRHGMLAGKTLHAALREGKRKEALHVARTFAAEQAGDL